MARKTLDQEKRQHYEEVVFTGWKTADSGINDGKARPEFEALAALFYKSSKVALTICPKGRMVFIRVSRLNRKDMLARAQIPLGYDYYRR